MSTKDESERQQGIKTLEGLLTNPSNETRLKLGMALHNSIRANAAARASRPLCERVLHSTLIDNGKTTCPECGVTLIRLKSKE